MTRLEELMAQTDHSNDDISELARIKREMAQEAKKLDVLANKTEEDYNLSRGAEFVKVKGQRRGDGRYFTDKEAERIAKERAEDKHGHYRSLRAEARGLYASLEALGQYIITLQSKKKNERDASGYDMDAVARMGPIV